MKKTSTQAKGNEVHRTQSCPQAVPTTSSKITAPPWLKMPRNCPRKRSVRLWSTSSNPWISMKYCSTEWKITTNRRVTARRVTRNKYKNVGHMNWYQVCFPRCDYYFFFFENNSWRWNWIECENNAMNNFRSLVNIYVKRSYFKMQFVWYVYVFKRSSSFKTTHCFQTLTTGTIDCGEERL